MNVERWHKVTEIFHGALARESAVRDAFVCEACRDDSTLRDEVEKLIAAHEAAAGLDEAAFGMPPDVPRVEPGTMLGPYQVEALIGAGGMGEVYRATDPRLGRLVALKILPSALAHDSDRVARFHREAQVLAALNHSHIAHIYGLESIDGVTALVMEMVEGATLADRIAEGPIPLDETLSIAKQIADALDAAHQRGIVHRDLKPANVKVTADGTVKVLDFGLAKALDPFPTIDVANSPAMPSPSMTGQGVILGTAAYMAPEQARGKRVDKRADIWAFGCVVYEMLTGRAAFSGESSSDTIAAVLERAPDWSRLPDALAPNIRRWLLRCLEKDPKRRARDIGDVALELEQPEVAGAALVSDGRTIGGHALLWMLAAALTVVTITSVAFVLVARRGPNRSLVRFTIAPPSDAAFSPGDVAVPAVQLAVSSDGQSIAFVAAPAGGRSLVWVRRLNEVDAKAVPGTVGASYPFWSPDGTQIGYFSAGKLMRVDLSGGRPLVLAEAPDAHGGGTWSRTRQILFAPDGSGLYLVNESGGSPTQVTTVDRDRRETAHRWPQFLPDGRQFLYFVPSGDPQVRGIYQGSLDGAAPRFLVASSFHGIFAKPEHILFVRDGDLVARSFTGDSHGVSGGASTLVRDVGGASNGYGSYSVSDTGVLIHAETFNPERELVWFTRSGERLERADGPSDYVDFRVAADDRIAIARNLPGLRTSDIFVLDQRRGAERRLTTHPALDASPVWSPDSTRLVFRSKRRNAQIDNPSNLYEIDTDGSGAQRLLLSTPVGKYPTDWSPDGRTVVYHTPNTLSGWDVWMFAFGEDPTPTALIATAANEMQARFSPDGRWIAYTSDASGRPDLYVKAYPPDARVWQISSGGGSQPIWTRDGRELLFVAPDGMLMAASVDTSSQFRIHRIRQQFRMPAPGFDPPFSPNFAVSADGKKVLVNARRYGGLPAVEVILNWPSQLAVGQ